MRNKILALSRDFIPYLKWLRPIAKTIVGCIVMQQMDFWFDRKPDGFYKFLEPCDHEQYAEGDSWCEELNCSPDEFRSAFDKIGMRYTSKGDYLRAGEDKFQGMCYCSYYDKQRGMTYYFRNHEYVDCLLDQLCQSERPSRKPLPPISRDGDSHLPDLKKPSPGLEKAISRNGDSHFIKGAKITAENTQREQQQQRATGARPEPSGFVAASDVVASVVCVPQDADATERAPVLTATEPTPQSQAAPPSDHATEGRHAEKDELEQALMKEGVRGEWAVRLVREYPAESIRQQIEYLPFRLAEKPDMRNRAGFLIASIRDDWKKPASYAKKKAVPAKREEPQQVPLKARAQTGKGGWNSDMTPEEWGAGSQIMRQASGRPKGATPEPEVVPRAKRSRTSSSEFAAGDGGQGAATAGSL